MFIADPMISFVDPIDESVTGNGGAEGNNRRERRAGGGRRDVAGG